MTGILVVFFFLLKNLIFMDKSSFCKEHGGTSHFKNSRTKKTIFLLLDSRGNQIKLCVKNCCRSTKNFRTNQTAEMMEKREMVNVVRNRWLNRYTARVKVNTTSILRECQWYMNGYRFFFK